MYAIRSYYVVSMPAEQKKRERGESPKKKDSVDKRLEQERLV